MKKVYKMESFNDRNREEFDNNGGSCNKNDQCSGSYWLGAFIIFIIVIAFLWWFGCNLGVAFVIAILLAIIVGGAIYAWENNDNDNDCHGKKKKKKCNNGWSVFLAALAMIIIWVIVLYIIYVLVRKAIVDEKCHPTPCCVPKCEVKCEPVVVADCKKDC